MLVKGLSKHFQFEAKKCPHRDGTQSQRIELILTTTFPSTSVKCRIRNASILPNPSELSLITLNNNSRHFIASAVDTA
jgi:hypothetical protein